MIEKIKNNKTYQIILILCSCLALFLTLNAHRLPVFSWVWAIAGLLWFRHIKSKLMFAFGCVAIFASFLLASLGSIGSFEGDLLFAFFNFLIVFIVFMADRILYPALVNKNKFLGVLFMPMFYIAVFNIADKIIPFLLPLGGAQYDIPLIMLAASAIGMQGLNFLVMFIASVISFIIENQKDKKIYKSLAVVSIVIICVIVLFSEIKLTFNSKIGDDTVRVAMALTPQDCDFTEEDDAVSYTQDLQYVQNSVENAAKADAKILCFGEESICLATSERDQFLRDVCDITKKNNIYVVLCAEVVDDTGVNDGLSENTLYVISNYGEIVGKYDKAMLIPVLESENFVKGDLKPLFLEIPYAEGKTFGASFAICFDSDNEQYISTIDDNTNILFVPSWTWDFFDPYHTDVQRYRAIENGISVVNPSICEKSTAIDWLGQTVAVSDQKVTGINHVTIADVPIDNDTTKSVYHYLAQPLYYISICLSAVLLIIGIVLKIKAKK